MSEDLDEIHLDDTQIRTVMENMEDGSNSLYDMFSIEEDPNIIDQLEIESKKDTSIDHIYNPDVSDEFRPKLQATFSSLDDGIAMYRKYAKECGFSTRLGSTSLYADNTIRKRHVRCNRYGESKKKKPCMHTDGDSKETRKSYSTLTGCMAMVGLDVDFETRACTVYRFDELHNHPLNKYDERIISRSNRQVTYLDQDFMLKASLVKLGPSKSFNVKACLKGGYDRMQPSKVDFKIFWRDCTTVLTPKYAQCVVDQMLVRKESYPNYYFNQRRKGTELHSMLWVDDAAKENYSNFSDVISVDGTYRSNKYKMIFVPFTAVNNHHKTVNVGAALIGDETEESYTWILEAFLEAHGKPPKLILSDQEAALTQSIAKVMPDSHHRLCMWHIMRKLPVKISSDTNKDSECRKRIHDLVWDMHIIPCDFEMKWSLMLDEFDLRCNKWLDDMYNIRDQWLPAYFRDIPMCGVMKTTSRSESANSYFNIFANHYNLLVNFMFNFDTAMSKQHHDQRKLDIVSRNTFPRLFSETYPLPIEKHASLVYTREVFEKVQIEIEKGFKLCYQKSFQEVNDFQLCTIVFKNQKARQKQEFQVKFNEKEMTIQCSCAMFSQYGYLCCHAFRVLIDNDVSNIPKLYILHRWKKNIINTANHTIKHDWGVGSTETSKLVQEASDHADHCINTMVHDKGKLKDLVGKLKALSIECDLSANHQKPMDKKQVIENIFGLKIPDSIEIEAPKGIRNKGGCKRSRMVSAAEKGRLKAMRVKRFCKGCELYVNHDKRNCTVNPSKALHPLKKK